MNTNEILKLINDFGLIIVQTTGLLSIVGYFALELKKLFRIINKNKGTKK